MKRWIFLLVVLFAATAPCASPVEQKNNNGWDLSQVPKWSPKDLDFFLHGSMSTEVVPEPVLRAFIKTYPDLFPSEDLTHLGLIADTNFGWPIGLSRKQVKHLGNLPSLGINCAACHTAEIHTPNAAPVRILGVTSHFDAEAFFGSIILATFRTTDPENMRQFAGSYLLGLHPEANAQTQVLLMKKWAWQKGKIVAAMGADPTGSKEVKPGALHQIAPNALAVDEASLKADQDLALFASSMLKLFHNMRAALHVPDQPPEKTPPASGPGRNDAFGLLSAGLFNAPQPYAPVKYGLVWNVSNRHWVHWDGNTRSPLGRNLLASLGLGAPLVGKHGMLDFAMVKRQTDLTELIKPPRYPYQIDQAAAKRGAEHYAANCASCHSGEESDKRLHPPSEVGTDPVRAEAFTKKQADRFNEFLADLQTASYNEPKETWSAEHAEIFCRQHVRGLGAVALFTQWIGSDHAGVAHAAN